MIFFLRMNNALRVFLYSFFIIIGIPAVSVAQDPVQSGVSADKTRTDIYQYIDSVMYDGKLQQMRRRQEILLSGEIKMGWFTLDMNRLKRYNQFEGVYLGAGGHTNESLFRSVSIGGYSGYGFKDRKTKYGLDVSVWPDQFQHLTINASYSYDTRESAGSCLFDERSGTLDPSAFRFFYANRMDYERKLSLSVYSRHRFVDLYGAIQRRIVDPGYDIRNGNSLLLPAPYNFSGIVAGIRLAPGGKILELSDKMDTSSSAFPVIWLQVTRGIPGMFNGEFNYNRFEGKIQIAHKINHLGRSSLQLIGSLLKGDAPYFEYFNGRGSYGNFGIYASGSFVTMHPDEFMNDRSLGLFFTHNFGNIIYHSEISDPSPVLVVNYGWGKLQTNPPDYYLPAIDMHKGFAEVGFQLNKLLDLKVYSLGLGAYYRLGAYSNATFRDNLVFKIVVIFPGKE